jgi:hypothetical protein
MEEPQQNSAIALGVITLSIMGLVMTLSITVSKVSSAVMLSVVMPTVAYFNCYAECLYAECH